MSITCKHGIPSGCPECRIQQLENILLDKQQDLNDARNGWESATEQLNEVCKQRDLMLKALQAAEELYKVGLLNAKTGQIGHVNKLRQIALATA